MTRARIPWDTLDRCATADELADLLRSHGIQGLPGYMQFCPLARATGWDIGSKVAYASDQTAVRPLTLAQQDFVDRFDNGEYPELLLEGYY